MANAISDDPANRLWFDWLWLSPLIREGGVGLSKLKSPLNFLCSPVAIVGRRDCVYNSRVFIPTYSRKGAA